MTRRELISILKARRNSVKRKCSWLCSDTLDKLYNQGQKDAYTEIIEMLDGDDKDETLY